MRRVGVTLAALAAAAPRGAAAQGTPQNDYLISFLSGASFSTTATSGSDSYDFTVSPFYDIVQATRGTTPVRYGLGVFDFSWSLGVDPGCGSARVPVMPYTRGSSTGCSAARRTTLYVHCNTAPNTRLEFIAESPVCVYAMRLLVDSSQCVSPLAQCQRPSTSPTPTPTQMPASQRVVLVVGLCMAALAFCLAVRRWCGWTALAVGRLTSYEVPGGMASGQAGGVALPTPKAPVYVGFGVVSYGLGTFQTVVSPLSVAAPPAQQQTELAPPGVVVVRSLSDDDALAAAAGGDASFTLAAGAGTGSLRGNGAWPSASVDESAVHLAMGGPHSGSGDGVATFAPLPVRVGQASPPGAIGGDNARALDRSRRTAANRQPLVR